MVNMLLALHSLDTNFLCLDCLLDFQPNSNLEFFVNFFRSAFMTSQEDSRIHLHSWELAFLWFNIGSYPISCCCWWWSRGSNRACFTCGLVVHLAWFSNIFEIFGPWGFNDCLHSTSEVMLGESILGWYHYETLHEMKKEPKTTKSFSWVLCFKCFHNYNFFFSCLLVACINIWLEVYFGILKNENC
jgi:hypothetical protein